MAQDLELRGGQADALGAALDAPPLEVDDQVLVADLAAAGGIGEVAVGAPQERLDAAHQLAQAEGLGQVVVRAQLQADDLVHLLVARGEHQHGRLGAGGAQAAQHLEAVDAGQAHVEEDEVRRQLRGDGQALLAVGREGDLVALLLEGVLDAARDGVLVLDDQDGWHGPGWYPGVLARARATMPRPVPGAWFPSTMCRARIRAAGSPNHLDERSSPREHHAPVRA